MNKLFVMPYIMGSESAKNLSGALNVKRINKNRTEVRGDERKTIINWGNTTLKHPELLKCIILNHPTVVAKTCNKLSFFKLFKTDLEKSLIPEWTDDYGTMLSWLQNENQLIVARKELCSHSGNGIVMFNREIAVTEGCPEAPLYTKYIPKKDEYRIHFSKKTGIFFKQRKALVKGTENPNWKIRNLTGGFIYANQDVETPEAVDKVCEMFFNEMNAGGLDFGALDVVYNEAQDRATILEVNTAPGLSGRTLEAYTEMIKAYIA
jgi:hypothetical protein